MLGLTVLLAACGGGSESDSDLPAATSSVQEQTEVNIDPATKAAQALDRSVLPAAATPLTVRAKGSPAIGIWPTMQVRVNGAVIGTQVVASDSYADYTFSVDSLPADAAIDVAFLNDRFANGEDRNLFVESISYLDATVLSTSPKVRYDRGVGAAAYDGVDVLPGQVGLYSAGALRFSGGPDTSAEITCGLPDFQADLLARVNAVRAAGATCGGRAYPPVAALVWNRQLQTAAAGHSLELARVGQGISHVSQDGRTLGQRIQATGYKASAYGENVAAGYGSAESVMTGWMNSPGHCANVMSASYKDLGVACSKRSGTYYGTYWTMDLARPR